MTVWIVLSIVVGIWGGGVLGNVLYRWQRRRRERLEWNGGICRGSGRRWKRIGPSHIRPWLYTDNCGNHLLLHYYDESGDRKAEIVPHPASRKGPTA